MYARVGPLKSLTDIIPWRRRNTVGPADRKRYHPGTAAAGAVLAAPIGALSYGIFALYDWRSQARGYWWRSAAARRVGGANPDNPTDCRTRRAGCRPRPVPACLVGYRDRSNPTQRSRRCGQSPVAENPPHRPGGWATNLVAPSFGLAKGIIVKSGLDPLRAADLSSPQWSIRLRSVRVLPRATFMLQSSSSIETRRLTPPG